MNRADAAIIPTGTGASTPSESGPWTEIIVQEFAGLPRIRDHILALRGRGAPLSSNADPDHYAAVLEMIPGDVSPYCVSFCRPGGEPAAAIMARITSRRVRSRLGYWSIPSPKLRVLEIVYGGYLTDGADDACQRLVDHLEELINKGIVQHVFINHLPTESPATTRLLQRGAIKSGLEPHWVVHLTPGSFKDTLSKHSSKHRSKLRRYDRRFSEKFENGLVLRSYTTREDIDEFLKAADAITKRSYHEKLGAPVRDTPLWRAMLDVEAELSRLRGFILWGDDTPICYQAGFVYNDVFLAHGRAFDEAFRDDRPGTILFFRVIEDLCGIGCKGFDLGFGDAEYKRLYADEFWNEASLRLYSKDLKGRIARSMDWASLALNGLLNRVDERHLARWRTWWKKRLGRKTDERGDT